MQRYHWECDCCGDFTTTPLARANPPAGWYVRERFDDADEGEPQTHLFCSEHCAGTGPMPEEYKDEARAYRARSVWRQFEAQRRGLDAFPSSWDPDTDRNPEKGSA
jgi:hypothetical protein